MGLTISSAFDAGNIRLVNQNGDQLDLEIVKDRMSDFYQWFYFRLSGCEGREITLRITIARARRIPTDGPTTKAFSASIANNGSGSKIRALPTAFSP